MSWRVEDGDRIVNNFHSRASHILSEMLKEARKEGNKPDWIGTSVWNGLLEKWNMPTYREKCDKAKKIVHQKKWNITHRGIY